MARSSALAFDEAPTIPSASAWFRQDQPQSPEEALFFSEAALTALQPVAQSDHLLGRLWRQRLALSATARLIAAGGHTESEAELRDICYFSCAGEDPGPAGRILLAWRTFTEPNAIDLPKTVARLATLLQIRASDSLAGLLTTAATPGQGAKSAISAATAILAVCLEPQSDDHSLALWLADIVLAHSLNWPAPVPLLGLYIRFADLYGPRTPRELLAAISSAYARAAADAIDLHCELAGSARRLLAVAPKLRSRQALPTIDLLLQEDALPVAEGGTWSLHTNRRIFDRLVQLGAVRELTGRTNYRLYGL